MPFTNDELAIGLAIRELLANIILAEWHVTFEVEKRSDKRLVDI